MSRIKNEIMKKHPVSTQAPTAFARKRVCAGKTFAVFSCAISIGTPKRYTFINLAII